MREIQVEDAGLHPGHARVGIHLEDPVHPGCDDHECIIEGRRPAGEPGAAPPGHEGHSVGRGHGDRVRDLHGRGGKADHAGPAHGGAGVAPVQGQLEWVDPDLIGAQGLTEGGNEGGAAFRIRDDAPMLPTGATTFGPVVEWS